MFSQCRRIMSLAHVISRRVWCSGCKSWLHQIAPAVTMCLFHHAHRAAHGQRRTWLHSCIHSQSACNAACPRALLPKLRRSIAETVTCRVACTSAAPSTNLADGRPVTSHPDVLGYLLRSARPHCAPEMCTGCTTGAAQPCRLAARPFSCSASFTSRTSSCTSKQNSGPEFPGACAGTVLLTLLRRKRCPYLGSSSVHANVKRRRRLAQRLQPPAIPISRMCVRSKH